MKSNSFWKKRMNQKRFKRKKMSRAQILKKTMTSLCLKMKQTVRIWKLSRWEKTLKTTDHWTSQLTSIRSQYQSLRRVNRRKSSLLRSWLSRTKSQRQWGKFSSQLRMRMKKWWSWVRRWMKMSQKRERYHQWQRRRTVRTRSRRRSSRMMMRSEWCLVKIEKGSYLGWWV